MGTVYLAGETFTQNQIVGMWEEKHGKKLNVKYITGNELEEKEKKVEEERVHNYWTQWPEFVQVSKAGHVRRVIESAGRVNSLDNADWTSLNVPKVKANCRMRSHQRLTMAKYGP